MTIKMCPVLHDHYPQQISDIPNPNGNFLAQFKLVNTAEYTYLQENLHYTTTTEPL